MEKNFQGLFFGGQEVKCPYCQLVFQSIGQLKQHKQTYCATNEQYGIVVEMFMKYADDIRSTGRWTSATERTMIMMKGLYLLKAEFDRYQAYLDNPQMNIVNQQKDKKFKEENTKKPNFSAMFSDFNQEAENMKQYPFLESALEKNYGEDLEKFIFRGENTSPDNDRNVPSWMRSKDAGVEEQEKANQYLDDISKDQINKVVAKREAGKDALDLLQDDPEYIKIFTVLSKDIRGGMNSEDVTRFLREPVSSWEDRFFNNETPPTRKEAEAMLYEIEHPHERKSKYVYQMRDLYAIHDAMSGHILTEVDLEKREQLQKLIAEREYLFYRESLFLDDVEKFKSLFLKRIDVTMYGLTPKPEIESAYRNLYQKLKYTK